MPDLNQILKQIDELDPVEREQLACVLSQEMMADPPYWPGRRRGDAQAFPSIVKSPGVCGGAARIIRTRIPVWALERMRQLGVSEIDILRSYPALRAVDLVEAWSYAERHRSEIEQAIFENEEE